MANAGKIVGEFNNSGPSTWGALRSIVYNKSTGLATLEDSNEHNANYKSGFKTTEGNGLIRTDWGYLRGNFGTQYGPNFNIQALTLRPPYSNNCRFSSDYDTSPDGMFTVEDRDSLVGGTVTHASGSLTILADAFGGPYYQVFSSSTAPDPITAIDLLTAF
jgi:hypothetical protein